MGTVTNFFLGANSGDGFQSLFFQLTGDRRFHDVMILKGGPGGGKSTFLEQLGAAMEETGTEVEYVRCSAEPESLDAVILPQLRCAAVDGTAPHAVEPRYPGAVERYVDLSRFCDVTAAKEQRGEIVAAIEAEQGACARTFHDLKAAAQVRADLTADACGAMDWPRAERRIRGVIARELKRRGGEAGESRCRFLGGMTCRGEVWRFDSVDALCPKVYELTDSYGLADGLLRRLNQAAASRGWDTVVCLCPEEPRRAEHLLIPGLGLAFVTSRPGMEYGGKPFRHIRLDAMTHPDGRARMRFETRMAHLLREEAELALREAGEAHRTLERLCNPYVDFDGVRALAAVETGRLLSWMK